MNGSGGLRPLGARGAPGADGAPGPAPSGSPDDFVTLLSSGVAQATSPATARTALGLAAAIRYGNQPGGDATWTGWTLGSGTVLTAGALRMTAATTGTLLMLAGRASGRAVRLEWLIAPVSDWDADTDILYVGTSRAAASQYWTHRCRGDAYMGAWVEQAAADLQPGAELVTGGPTIATPTTWMALELSFGRVQYLYGTGTGSGGRTPPAPSEWKLYGDYLASTYTGLGSSLTEDRIVANLEGTCVIDLAALTIIPLSPVVS